MGNINIAHFLVYSQLFVGVKRRFVEIIFIYNITRLFLCDFLIE